MEEVQRQFVAWLIRFALISTVVMVIAHLIGRRMRRRKSAGKPPSSLPPTRN